MKTRIIHAVILSCVFFMFCFASCNNLFQKQINEENYTQNQTAYITIGSIQNSSRNIGTLYPSGDDIKTSLLSDISLSGKWQGGASETLVEECTDWTTFNSKFPLPIQTGSWEFTLQATYNSMSFSADCSEDIEAGTTKTLSFSLVLDSSEPQYGGLSITVNISSGTASSVIATLKDSGGNLVGTSQTLTPSSNVVTFTRSLDNESQKLPTGLYDLSFEFKSEDSTANYSETLSILPLQVRVVAGLNTTASVNWGLNTVYTITYHDNDGTLAAGQIRQKKYSKATGSLTLPEMEKDNCVFDGWYEEEDFSGSRVTLIPANAREPKEFYAHFVDTIYIKNGGAAYSTSSDGTKPSAPLASVADAIQKIHAYNRSDINWKIEVDGTITTDDAASITLQKKTGGTTAVLDGNNNGTVLTINTAVPVTLKNITIQNGYAEGDENFEAETSKGGGLYISSGSNVTIDIGTEICSNKAYSSGGGIYITGATLIMNGGTIGGASKANKARQGNGIFAQNSTITLNGGTITYNEYIDASDYGYEGGGGIYITGTQASPSALTIEDGVNITYNKNNDNGGGVYAADYVTFIMNGGNISYNTVDTSYSAMGGGIKINNHSSFTMNDGIISHNSGMNGGGIVSTSNVTINDGEISYNKTTYNAPEVDGGGIIFLTYNDATEDITLSITGGTISHNEAISYGGGVLVDGNRTIFNMTGGSITENKTTATGTGAFDGGGGAVYFQGKTFTMSGSASMTDNETGGCGGAIRFVTGNTITISGGTISGNSAAYSCGGIDIEEGCTLNMTGGTVTGNTAGTTVGGVGCGEGASTLFMSGSALIKSNNSAEEGAGVGCVDLYLGYINATTEAETFTGGIQDNQVTGTGKDGGGYWGDGCSVKMCKGTISGNVATGSGGGLFVGENFTMSGGSITGNSCGANGGGLVAYKTITITDGTISENEATGNGGGIWKTDDWAIEMSDGSIQGNTAANGGGIYFNDGDSSFSFIMSGGTISENTASSNGGAIYTHHAMSIYMSGNAYIPYGVSGVKAAGKNDVYLWERELSFFYITAPLTPPDSCIDGKVVYITPQEYANNSEILAISSSATTSIADEYSKFAIVPPADGTNWFINESGYLVKAKIGSKNAPTAVGDIVFNDGSARAYNNIALSDEEKAAAIAVIFYVGTGLNNNGDTTTNRVLGLGFYSNPTKSKWGSNSAGPYYCDTLIAQFTTNSGCDTEFDSTSYKNGTNLLTDLAAELEAAGRTNDTNDASLYPYFYFAINYKNTETKLSGSDYESGWYMPTLCELCELGKTYKSTALRDIILEVKDSDFLNGETFWASSMTDLTNGNKEAATFNTTNGCTFTSTSYDFYEYSSLAIRQFN